MFRIGAITTAALFLLLFSPSYGGEPEWTVHLQKRSKEGRPEAVVEKWNPQETAIIVCDMWSNQTFEKCAHNSVREEDLAARMNEVFEVARAKGMLIVFAPSANAADLDRWYGDLPARKATAKFRHGYGNERHWDFWVHGKGGEGEHSGIAFPGERDSPGWRLRGEAKCDAKVKTDQPQPPQLKTLKIDDRDALTDDFVELIGGKVDGKEYKECLFKERGIKNVILTGCHTDICVMGRPFGLRALKMAGYNAVLCRDLTNSTYNCNNSLPGPSHVEGTAMICDYIEQFICPSLTSTEITGEPPFQFDEAKVARLYPSRQAVRRKEFAAEKGTVRVEIVRAFYGPNEMNRKEVTAILKKQFDGTRYIPIDDYNGQFGDPNPGTLKHLWVEYTIDGKGRTQKFAENAEIVLEK